MADFEIRPLVERDVESLVAIRRVAFLDPTDYSDPGARSRLLGRLEHMTGVFVRGELVAAGAMLPFNMLRGEQVVRVGGLASVVSAGEHRRKGHVREMLRAMLEQLHDDSGWCLEYPFDPAYYAKFGWQTIPNGLHVEVPPSAFPRVDQHSARRVDPQRPAIGVAIRAIYGAWAARFNFTMTRDGNARDDWGTIFSGSPWEEPSKTRFVYLADEAYCVLEMRREKDRGTVAYVVDCAWSSQSGRRELFGFWRGFDGQVSLFHLQLPYGEPALLDWTPHLVRHKHPLQARIVDVTTALTGAAVAEEVDLKLAIEDDFCPWNEGTFHFSSPEGRLQVTKSPAPPDATLNIRELTLFAADQPSVSYRTDLPSTVRTALAAVSARPAFMPLADYF